MKNKRKWYFRKILAVLLCVCMIAPDAAPLVSYGAELIGNAPRHVSFARPEALTLEELGISAATAADAEGTEVVGASGTVSAATASDASRIPTATDSEIRRPEAFYELEADEPDGILVQFDEERGIRTYQQTENTFVTVIGGYSGLYRDVDGRIRSVDNRIRKTGEDEENEEQDPDEDEEDAEYWDDGEIELVNDLTVEIPSEKTSGSGSLTKEGLDEDQVLPRVALNRKKTESGEKTGLKEPSELLRPSSLARAAGLLNEEPVVWQAAKEEAALPEAAAGTFTLASFSNAAKKEPEAPLVKVPVLAGYGKKATPADAEAVREAYYNEAGPLDLCLPEQMDGQEGYTISNRRDALEIIPLEGDYSRSAASGNMVRYSSVFPNVDVQYTVLGGTVKEDILLLDRQEQTSFSYRLKSDTLKFKKDGETLLAYRESWRRPQFALTAPVMVDAEGNVSTKIRLSYQPSTRTLTYTADEEWLADEERAYPVRLDPAGAVLVDYSAFTMNMVAKGGELVGEPNVNIKTFPISLNPMAGYSEDYGYCRALIQVNADWESLMGSSGDEGSADGDLTGSPRDDSENMDESGPDGDGDGVKDVELVLHTVTRDAANNTLFALFEASASWDPSNISWDIMEKSEVDTSMTQLGEWAQSSAADDKKNREMTFNVTDTYYKWIQNPESRTGFVLQALMETGDNTYVPGEGDIHTVNWAETFYNHTGGSDFGPCLRVAWQGRLENVDLKTLEMSAFEAGVDAGIAESPAGGRTTLGILAHGVSQAGSRIDYQVKTQDGTVVLEKNTTAHKEADCPDFTEVDGDCLAADHLDSNWQSDAIFDLNPLERNRIYYIEAMGTGHDIVEDEDGEPVQGDEIVTTDWKKTDEFLLYEVQATDILPRIARHYGVDTKTLQEDNHFGFQLVEAGNVLFIRNPQTDEPYTMPLDPSAMEEFLQFCLMYDLDPRCMVGGEPVNLSTGGFYLSRTDAAWEDLGGEFSVTRSYSGLNPYFRSEFGMGWNSMIGERLMVLPDGRILFTMDSGKGIIFTKDGDSYRAPDGYDYKLEEADVADYLADGEDEDDETESEEDGLEAAGKAGNLLAAQAADDAGEDGDGDNNDAGDGTETSKVAPSDGWQITEPDGTVRTFNYYGLLLSKEDRKGHKTSFTYDSDYLLTEIETPSGKVLEVTMEPDGKITEIALPDGNILLYEYDDEDNLISYTNPEGDTVRYEYDENHRMTAWYDENGTRVVENVLDEKGRVTEQTDALGSVMYFDYSGTTTTTTDNNGNVTVYEQDDELRNIRVRYANGEEERRAYSADNRLESETDANGITTRYEYDENGNLLKETRADGSSAGYTYNELNLPLTATDYEGNVTRYSYDDLGNLLTMTDGAGAVTRISYDELSRVTEITDGNGGTSSFTYEGTEAPVRSYTDPEGGVTTYEYDALNRLLVQTDPEGNTTEHAYNANGWEIYTTAADGGVTAYEFSPAGEVLSITDPMGTETVFTYDAQHNILSGTDSLGNTLTYSYDANYNRVSETDAKGNETLYGYDSRNRLTAVTDALGNTIRYELDGNGNAIHITDRRGNESGTDYDLVLNLPAAVRDELGNETRYEYDGNGNITKVSYPDGTSVSSGYDGAGRLVSTMAQNGLVTRMSYDGNGNLVRITDDKSRVYRFEYDGNNRLVKAMDPLGGVTEYVYDGAGNQIQVTDANGNASDYAYDAVGRLLEARDALGGTVITKYDLNSNPLSMTDQNGNTTSWHYDVIGQLLAQTDAAGNVTAMDYDALGNVTKVTDALKGETSMETDD